MTKQVALSLIARGYKVFPCVDGRKFPACAHGFLDASDDPEKINRWFAYGRKNIGLATGDASGVVVIDLDTYKIECAPEFTRLQATLGELPKTYTVRTPRGGLHLYFRKPEGYDLRSYNNVIAKGVDVRGNGGYVVAEGSRVTEPGCSGKYDVLDDLPVAELPEAWAKAWQALNIPVDAALAKKAARAAAKAKLLEEAL